MTRLILCLFLLLGLLFSNSSAAEVPLAINPVTSTGPAIDPGLSPARSLSPAIGSGTSPYPVPASSPGDDVMPLKFPKKIPTSVKEKAVPSVEPFFEQFDRYHLVKFKARLIEPWVYVYAIEPFVADYEEAMQSLELCDECLDEALLNIINRSHKSLTLDPAIDLAKAELDKADSMITFLIEIAKLEL